MPFFTPLNPSFRIAFDQHLYTNMRLHRRCRAHFFALQYYSLHTNKYLFREQRKKCDTQTNKQTNEQTSEPEKKVGEKQIA